MSHYVVLVILPSGAVPTQALVADLMEPFNECTQVEEYDEPCYCVGDRSLAESRAAVAGDIDKLRLKYSEDQTQDWDEMIEPVLARAKKIEVAHPLYGTPNPGCTKCQGLGTYKSTYNPDSLWDWFDIGGRWSEEFAEFSVGEGNSGSLPHTEVLSISSVREATAE